MPMTSASLLINSNIKTPDPQPTSNTFLPLRFLVSFRTSWRLLFRNMLTGERFCKKLFVYFSENSSGVSIQYLLITESFDPFFILPTFLRLYNFPFKCIGYNLMPVLIPMPVFYKKKISWILNFLNIRQVI